MLIKNLILCKRYSSLSLYRFYPKYCNFDEREGGVGVGIALTKYQYCSYCKHNKIISLH